MRAAPLKGDCITCQAPEPTRLAINGAIWTDEGMRYAEYISQAKRIAHESEVESLATYSKSAVLRHVAHIEASWREIPLRGELVGREEPVTLTYEDSAAPVLQAGAKAARLLNHLLDSAGEGGASIFKPRELIDVMKVGNNAATAREKSRLARNQQAIDVAAIFAHSAGFLPLAPEHEADEVIELDAMKRELEAERAEITEARDAG